MGEFLSSWRHRLSRRRLSGFEILLVTLAFSGALGLYLRGEGTRDFVSRVDICAKEKSKDACRNRVRRLLGVSTGKPGESGASGTSGVAGARGARGATGIGQRGASGIRGTSGAIGATGIRGLQGLAGSRGPRGPAGPPGPRGPQGPPGVPGPAAPVAQIVAQATAQAIATVCARTPLC